MALVDVLTTQPALDLRADLAHAYSSAKGYRTQLFSNHRQLLVNKTEVILIRGSTVSKKLTYDEKVISATYTTFSSNDTDALVVCLKKAAYIYYPDGRSYVVSFPFTLKKSFPFESGLILEKDQPHSHVSNMGGIHPPQFHAAKFLTLVDPTGDFKIVTTSSTSIISPHEEMMSFPILGLNRSLCSTYNSHDRTIAFYHKRTSTRGPKKMNSSKYPKRKHSLISTPNPSRILEDEGGESNSYSGQNVLSLSMDKKRTSTLLSGISSIARMGSEPGFSEHSKVQSSYNSIEFSASRRDMILTRVDTLHPKANKSQLRIYDLSYEDQEAIVISNLETKETNVYIFNRLTSSNLTPRYNSCYPIQCHHAIPLNNAEHPGWLLVLENPHLISMVNPFLNLTSSRIDLSTSFDGISMLLSSYDNEVALVAESEKTYIITLVLDPSTDLVKRCLKCFKYLSGSKIDQAMWLIWRSSLMLDEKKDEWNAFIATILSITYRFDQDFPTVSNPVTNILPQAKVLKETFHLDYSIHDMVPYLVLSLHLMYEETKLDVLAESDLNVLGILLTQLTIWVGWHESWYKYYMVNLSNIDMEVRFMLAFILESPPNLLESLGSLFTHDIREFITFSQLTEESDNIDAIITPRTNKILRLFELIVSHQYGANDVVDLMCEFGITLSELETYPAGVIIPLKECILICQENPAFEWNSKTLELVGRKDLSMLLSSKLHYNVSQYNTVNHGSKARRDINHVLANIMDRKETVAAWDGQSEADRINITKLIFDYDRRYYEITTLLHQTRTQTATLITDEGMSEYDIVVLQRELAALVALRTLTIPLGRAALFYAGRMPLLTEKFPIPKFNLNTLIAPTMTNIVHSDGAISQSISDWGYFHNGVSSGLSISKESKGISGSWIIFNRPPELNSQHAGFLLGLGLNGHLKKLEEWHIYNYLGPKHPLTSVGLLIGMAASLKGSMDNKLTKVLSVHAVALLPQGANDLNVPIMVQTAGLIGIGLLYLETQHRRMSEILLSQLCGTSSQTDHEDIHEGYRLAAGISLGLVNLGKGDDLRGLNDTHVIDRLLSLAISMKDFQPIQDLDKSSSGAIIALGFIYMRTGNTAIANKLKVPTSEQLMDYVRSDILLLRCVSKNLIMWDNIGCAVEWVESEIPESLLLKYSNTKIDVLDSDQLAYFNILGGICLSVAIKYASTHNIEARNTILHYCDMMSVITMNPAANYDQKVTYNSASNVRNLLALCLSLVMAGSGDLDTFRRLRILHGDTHNGMGYGNYMAINMALGFLFLGGGQYAFDNSNFSIACLLISLYPVFPTEESDYEVHLQVLRHFWALSVEPRCLIIRDVNTRKALKVLVTVKLKNGKVIETISPSLLPHLDEISMISTKSQDYFNVQVDFQLNSEYLEILRKSLTIYVYKRCNYQLLKSSVGEILKSENKSLQIENGEIQINQDIAKFLNLSTMSIGDFEKQKYLYESSEAEEEADVPLDNLGLSIFSIIDNKIELQRMATKPRNVQDLWNLKLIFAFTDRLLANQLRYMSLEFIEQLKQQVWQLAYGGLPTSN